MHQEIVKIVVYVPESHAQKVRHAMGEAGAGQLGNYKHCSFSVKGIGRFFPLEGAKPTFGKVGKLEEIAEERIETICNKKDLDGIIKAIKEAHPYENIAFDVYPLIQI